MKARSKRKRLLAPLVYLAAIVLLLEDWLWDIGARMMGLIARWPPLAALEARIRALPGGAALAVFLLPAVLLFPIKILALFAMAHGHAMAGVAVIVATKVGGAAFVARLYSLTLPALLSVSWFARLHNGFVALKNRWIARLRASAPYRHASAAMAAARAALRALWRRLHQKAGAGGRHRSRPARLLRHFAALWRASRIHHRH